APPRSPPATMALAAIFVFLLVCAVHVLESMLDLAKKRGSVSDEQVKLRVAITQLLKESSALSTPSTFAQAAKLKRLAAAKEKELAKLQQSDIKGKQSLHEKYGKVLKATKVLHDCSFCSLLYLTFIASGVSHEIDLVVGPSLWFARSVVLECTCSYRPQPSSTALRKDVLLERR
uniref:Uncharacterized protein n=2 Tax=Aegilops tauschii subsp. strangulata TaxID=200361 RepID=A0A453R1W7_AEGTS